MLSMDRSVVEVLSLSTHSGTSEWCLWMDKLPATTETGHVRESHSWSWFYDRITELSSCKGNKLYLCPLP